MKMKLLLFAGLIIGSIGLSFLLSDNLYAKSETVQASPVILFAADLGTTDEPAADADAEQPASSCRVEGIGWIICPVAREMSKFVDAAYGFVSSLLKVQPLTTTGEQVNIYNAWAIMRNFANVAFVIAFMIIIFSQLTSVGLNNYGIKKMLPRLIVAAILVNASFWICAIAVDISNILGASINSIFRGMEAGLPSTPGEGSTTFSNVAGGTATGWEAITGLVLGGAAVGALYIGLSALLPALLAALVAIVTVFMVLTLRQALIVLLIIISPLAFVAYLLPNTESLYKKWQALFKTLLLMYPIIAGIFGASALASKVVMSTAKGEYEIAIQIMGALIAIIPLALTPIVMKTAGGLLNRFGGVVNNPNKGPFDRMRKGADGVRKRQEGRRAIRELNGKPGLGFGKYKRAEKRSTIDAGIEASKKRAGQKYTAGVMQNNAAFQNKAAGGTAFNNASPADMQRVLAGAKFTINQAEAEEVKAEHAFIDNMEAPDLQRIIANTGNNNSEAKVAAAIERYVSIASTAEVATVIDQYGSNGQAGSIVNRTLAESLAKNGPQFLKASDIDNISLGNLNGKSTADIARNNINDGVYSQEKMVVAPANELSYAHSVAQPGAGLGKEKLEATANLLINNDNLNGKIKHNQAEIYAIAGALVPTGAPQAQPTSPTTQSPTINIQPSAPSVLNITHNSTPANSRTSPPPNTSGYGPAPNSTSGLYVPSGYQSQPQSPPPQPPQTPPNP